MSRRTKYEKIFCFNIIRVLSIRVTKIFQESFYCLDKFCLLLIRSKTLNLLSNINSEKWQQFAGYYPNCQCHRLFLKDKINVAHQSNRLNRRRKSYIKSQLKLCKKNCLPKFFKLECKIPWKLSKILNQFSELCQIWHYFLKNFANFATFSLEFGNFYKDCKIWHILPHFF